MLPIIAARVSKSKRNFHILCKKYETNLSAYCQKCKKAVNIQVFNGKIQKFNVKSLNFYWANCKTDSGITTLVHAVRSFLRFSARWRALPRGRLSTLRVKSEENPPGNCAFLPESKKELPAQTAPENDLMFGPLMPFPLRDSDRGPTSWGRALRAGRFGAFRSRRGSPCRGFSRTAA